MNKKQELLDSIVDVVIECCDMENEDGNVVTRELLLSNSKKENVVMTRCILVFELMRAGFTITTCASLLGCKPQTARMLMFKDGEYYKTSAAYRVAKVDSTGQVL